MKPPITYDQFESLDIRIGTIVSASAPEWSKKLLRFEVDFGNPPAGGGKRIIFSGIKSWYTPESFVGKSFPFLINLAPKKMGEEESQGMMLMADTEEKPIVFTIENVPSGTVVR